MAGCSSGCCPSGCGHDHSSKAAQSPSLVSIDVVRGVLSQALLNMAKRCVAASQQELGEDQVKEADQKLAEWLGDTFSGLNAHFEAGPENWNPVGLAEHLRDCLAGLMEAGREGLPEGDEEVIFMAMAFFMSQAYSVMLEALKTGANLEDSEELPEPMANFVESWTMVLVGAPTEMYE